MVGLPSGTFVMGSPASEKGRFDNEGPQHLVAIKAFALLRRDFSGVSTEKGVHEYLILLSICETCRFKGVSFLDFLRSGELDIDAFRGSRGRRSL